ncbi:30S ribosomal protein S12 methylthiotransferase RimO [Halosquirtibacter laminarini]|uniref:30S ribosomal protein S12 methylthiotransferase RimO n=1 Tax=Halosquirtibacter laminarini TaxID=3374600 RepID=A0AC61NC05_9BACT|nr:30S ribosomal protein S12 methylthiotransferase RimO [Prolixibacteraceae bacterium]
MNKKVNIVTLGCSKNLIDSELFMGQLEANGYEVITDSNETDADIVAINTCGFILDAKEESINTILDFVEAKKRGDVSKIFVFGCLTERYKDELMAEIPEVDGFYGKFQVKKMVEDLEGEYKMSLKNQRYVTTPSHYAFLKISEGCNRTCSYCAIPYITGKHKSRPIEDIVIEATLLAKKGVKELLVIAQDLSFYGLDLYKEQRLAELVRQLAKIEGIEWIKLHYAYPSNFPYDLLPVMQQESKVSLYLDIALQHISDNMLKLMRRNINKEETLALLARIRKEVPGIHLRTTLLVGHPGETEEDFNELCEFVETARFERLGVFAYSHEDNTYAGENYEDIIVEETKQARVEKIMELQQNVSLLHNEQKVGKDLKVVIDRVEGDLYIARTEFDSPDVDGEVFVKSDRELSIGEFVKVHVTEAADYDLYAEIIE